MKESQDGTTVRQNGTYTPTRKHEVNLRRNPTLHFQIGLILALLVAIFFIEIRLPEKAAASPRLEIEVDDTFVIGEVRPEPKKVVPLVKKKLNLNKTVAAIIDNPISKKDILDIIETPLKSTEPVIDDPMIDPSIPQYDDYSDEEPVSIAVVERVPLFPGCEGLDTNDQRRDCMNSKMSRFVARKFRTDKVEGLGLKGENRIFVLFTIDTEGDVIDIKTQGSHSILEKEALRVTALLPKMTPGKMGQRNVNVTMALPINFIVQD